MARHVLVDTGQGDRCDLVAGFFVNLAPKGVLNRLVELENTSGRFPSFVVPALRYEDSPFVVSDDGSDTDGVTGSGTDGVSS